MKKVSFSFAFGFLFVLLFIFLVFFPAKQGNTVVGDEVSKNVEHQSGYSDGYRDAMDGVESLCATKKCIAQDPYERGYKLGYKKGIRDQKKKFSKASDEGFIRPLIDSPGNTIGSDFNGDGIHDFIVGARFNNDGGTDDEGAAYIFFGASNLSGTKSLGGGQSADVTILGKAANDFLGKSVSGAGDINGDGFDDIIVGADGYDISGTNREGAAYIFFGASNLSGTKSLGGVDSADLTILGKAASDQLGKSVSGAGDVNGDGFDDIIVGADGNDDGENLAGAAYIFFGASNLRGTFIIRSSIIVSVCAYDNIGKAIAIHISQS